MYGKHCKYCATKPTSAVRTTTLRFWLSAASKPFAGFVLPVAFALTLGAALFSAPAFFPCLVQAQTHSQTTTSPSSAAPPLSSSRASITLPRIHSPIADSLAALLESSLPDTTRVNILIELARALWANNLQESRKFALQALEIAKKTGYALGMANALNTVGVTYYYQGWYEISLSYHQRALELRTKLNDSAGIGHSMNNIGLIYMGQYKYNEALSYLREALAIYKRLNRINSMAAALNNIGSIYRRIKLYDSAEASHREALAIVEGTEYKSGIALCYISLSNVLEDAERYQEALEYQDKALQLYQEAFNRKGILNALFSKASVYLEMKRYKEAYLYIQQATDLALQMDSRPELRDCYELGSRIQEALGETAKAFELFKLYAKLKDSLANEESDVRAADFNAKYDAERKAKQIALLTAAREREKVQLNFLLALFVFSLMAVALVYIRYRVKRKSEADLQIANAMLQEKNTLLDEALERLEHTNKEIEEKNRALEALNSEKSEFLGIVAHDLKNPLSIVQNLATIIHDDVTSSKFVKDTSHVILTVAEKMFELVKNLLDVNQLEGGGRKFEIYPVNAVWSVTQVMDLYLGRAESKRISLEFEPPEESLLCMADELALSQVVENLISNAVKYSPLGGRVCIGVVRAGDAIRITVQDEGPGLTDSDKNFLFQKFGRLSAQPTGGEHSTGLGLSIVKSIVTSLGGAVWCESEYGKGATFIVELPAA